MEQKKIKNFPGYTIDKNGCVFSLLTGKTLKVWDGSGYDKVSLRANGKTTKLYLHRLLALHFLENPLNLPTVNHKNGNRKDNRLENLEWSSYVEQELHKNRVINARKRGVFWQHNGWCAKISVNGKQIYLGRFSSQEEAHVAYFNKYKELRGKEPW